MAAVADIRHGAPDEETVQHAGETHVPLGVRIVVPDAEADCDGEQCQQEREAPILQVIAEQGVEYQQAREIEQQVPQIGVSQIACYDAPPFSLVNQDPVEGDEVIWHCEEEDQAGE